MQRETIYLSFRSVLYSILVISGITLIGCTNTTTSDNHTDQSQDSIHCQIDRDIYPMTVSIDIKDAKPLEFKPADTILFSEDVDNIMGVPSNLVVSNDTLYLIDNYKAPGIYAYTKTGEQVFAYCARGNGPKEFNSLSDLCVTKDKVAAYDYLSGHVIVLDKFGNFHSKTKVAEHTYGAMLDRDGGMWMDFSNQQADPDKLVWKKDSLSNMVGVLPVPDCLKGMVNVPLQQFHLLSNGEITFLPSFEHQIFTLHQGTATLRYNLDFNGLWPEDDEIKRLNDNFWAVRMRDFPVTRLICQENDKWLIVGFRNKEDLYLHIFNKSESEGTTYKDTAESYYIPMDVVGDDLYMLRTDGNLDVLELD